MRFVPIKTAGELMRVGERLLVDWRDDTIDAEAWLKFAPGSKADEITLTLAKVDPDADFSHDYEDLILQPRARL
jgi:hypothetical protein